MISKTFGRALPAVGIAALLAVITSTGAAATIDPIDRPAQSPWEAAAAATGPAISATTDLPSTTVPRHVSGNGYLQLLGINDSGIAVRQSVDRLLSGELGSRLTLRGKFDRTDAVLAGSDLTWSEGKVLHRVAIGTGVDSPLTTEVKPLAATADGYLGLVGQTLTRYVTGAASIPLLTSVTKVSAITVDADEVLVAYTDPAKAANLLTIVPLAGGPSTWSKVTSYPVRRLGFSDRLVGWVSLRNGAPIVQTQPRVGGKLLAVSGPAASLADGSEFAVAGNRAAWPGDVRSVTMMTGGGTATHQPIPGRHYWGIIGYGDDFFVGVSGKHSYAGIYRIPDASSRPNISVPKEPSEISSWSLAAGFLRYNDDTTALKRDQQRIWQHSVTGSGAPVLSKEKELLVWTRAWSRIWFSAARGAVVYAPNTGGDHNQLRLVDRGKMVGTLPKGSGSLGFKMSGPYLQAGAKIYGTDRKVALDLTGFKPTSYDHYGANVVYARSNGQIWWRDLTRKASKSNPRLVVDTCSGTCEPNVRIWGNKVAYLTKSNTFVVRTLTNPAARVVNPGVPAAELMQFSLREGTLLWTTSKTEGVYRQFALDLSSAGSKPIELNLAGTVVDGHYAAGLDPERNLVVQRLPFGGAQKPRLIGTVARASFSPNGHGRTALFRPAFDTTKPLENVKLTIRSGSRVIRTLTGTGPDGSIRDLSWDGRTGSGAKAKAGTYTWTLTATAVDGEGSLVAVNGGKSVLGTIKLTR